jgi:hypothetical protein
MFRSARRLALMTFVAGLTMAEASAQAGRIAGTVHARGDSAANLSNVLITLTPGDRSTRTDSLGRFRFTGLPTGTYLLATRQLGYEAAFRTVEAEEDRETSVRFSLVAVGQQLATITVSGKLVTYPIRLREAYLRVSRTTGKFFTREQIDSLFPLDVSSLLMRVPGVRLTSDAVEFARCTELGSSNQHVQVWVDGQRWTNYSRGEGLEVRAYEAIRDITPSSIQLMEIYAGVSRVPVEYLDDACAVILIWRK